MDQVRFQIDANFWNIWFADRLKHHWKRASIWKIIKDSSLHAILSLDYTQEHYQWESERIFLAIAIVQEFSAIINREILISNDYLKRLESKSPSRWSNGTVSYGRDAIKIFYQRKRSWPCDFMARFFEIFQHCCTKIS